MKIEPEVIADLVSHAPKAPVRAKYQHLYNALKEAIVNDRLPDKCTLPPTRALSEVLGVSRGTVVKAYELLKLEGYLEAQVGSAHLVKQPEFPEVGHRPVGPSPHKHAALSEAGRSFDGSAARLNSIDDEGVAFRPGVPPLDLFPIGHWKRLQNEYWQSVRASDLTYHSGSGLTPLRQTIAGYLQLRRNMHCNYRQIFVVGGSLQSLYLIGNLLAGPGDSVFVEDPTFPNVHSVFKGLRTRTSGIRLNAEGIDIDELRNTIDHKSKLVHVTPACHYPFGIRMSDRRKLELPELANDRGLYLIENDYEHEVHYPQHNGRSLFSMDDQDRTFYVSTFNRTLHPSIRVGFVVVPRHLIGAFEAMIMHGHRSISPVLQTVFRGFFERTFLHDHLNNVAKQSAHRHGLFMGRLRRDLALHVSPLNQPAPSLHIAATLSRKKSDVAVTKTLKEQGIIAHPLSKCYVDTPRQQGLIFGYSCIRPQNLNGQLDRLVQVLKMPSA